MVFGIPGGHAGHIFIALSKRQNSIRTVLVREEVARGVMAEVYGRLTGRPGVIIGQGPWVLGNGLIGTIEAFLSSSPMLLLTDSATRRLCRCTDPTSPAPAITAAGTPRQKFLRGDQAGRSGARAGKRGARHPACDQARAYRAARAGRGSLQHFGACRPGRGRTACRVCTKPGPTFRSRCRRPIRSGVRRGESAGGKPSGR